MTKKQRISFRCLFFLLSALLAVSGFMAYKELSGRQKEKEDFEELAELVYTGPVEESKPEKSVAPDGGEEPEPARRRSLAPLLEQNSDCISWLCIPGTVIDYPVMHTPKNPQRYLRLNFYGGYSRSGTPFLDGRCGLDSGNLIIYGHSMRNGTMFGSLRKYTNKAYLKEHPVIEFETEAGCAEYAVFAVAAVKKWDDWYGFVETPGQPDFEKKIESIRSRALYHTDIIPEYGRQLLTLSTCYGSGGDGRLLVIAVKV